MEQLDQVAKRLGKRSLTNSPPQIPYSTGICELGCPVCGGIGYVRFEVPVSDPNFGKIQFCPRSVSRVYASGSGLDESERGMTWDAVADLNNAREAVKVVQSVIELGKGWVFLWGDPGLAKTLVLQIAVAEYVRSGREGVYVRMVEIIDDVRKAFDSGDPSSEELRRIERWSKVPLLAIDEFDRSNETNWSENRRFLLMDRRYQETLRGNGVTLMASNSDPKLLSAYLRSRIFDGRFDVIQLKGDDVRRGMEW